MATIITSEGNVKTDRVQVSAYCGFWVSTSLDLNDGDSSPWTEREIFDKMLTQINPWFYQAADLGIEISLEDVRNESYTREEVQK